MRIERHSPPGHNHPAANAPRPMNQPMCGAANHVTGELDQGFPSVCTRPPADCLHVLPYENQTPPPAIGGDSHPGIKLAEQEWQEINTKMWKWLHCHPYNDMAGDGLPEDERTWAFDFRVMTPTA